MARVLKEGLGGLLVLAVSITGCRSLVPVSACVESTRVISVPADRYCGWPTLAETREGELGVVFSGDRDDHVCPWGKVLLKRSADGGITWSDSETVANGILDDRDAGLTRLANGDLVVVWFTSTAFHDCVEQGLHLKVAHVHDVPSYRRHWAKLDKAAVKTELGSFSVRSTDGGRTWEPKVRIPASAPHGCVELRDGRLLVVGNEVVAESTDRAKSWHELARLPKVPDGQVFCEAHVTEGEDGGIRCYARGREMLMYCESLDGGRTWTHPAPTKIDGSWNPPFLSRLRDGRILMTFGRRADERTGVYARIGDRNGSLASLEDASEIVLYTNWDSDLGYASTVERLDGKLVTVFYAHDEETSEKASLLEVVWRLPESL